MRLGRIEVGGGFLLLTAWLNYMDDQGVVPLVLLACLLHELGHLAVLRGLGVPVGRIRLTVVGAELEVLAPISYGRELAAALAGPAVNLVLALALCRLECGRVFAGINLMLALFNLLPVGGLDGGRALRAGLSLALGPEISDAIGGRLDALLTGVLLALGLFFLGVGGKATLWITACWLFSSIWREKRGKRACHPVRKRVK